MTTLRSLLLALLLASCGGGGADPFVLAIVGDDGSVGGAPIARSAIDRVQVVLVPQAIDGPFAPMAEQVFDGGAATARVTAAGEWVLTLERAWLDDNAESTDALRLFVLLAPEATTDGATLDPSLRVLFYRGTEVVAESTPRFVEWPLVPGNETNVTVVCRAGAADACAGR
ncbi:MAG: hypothetical protein R3B99_30085 [Polyangiales bacterium]